MGCPRVGRLYNFEGRSACSVELLAYMIGCKILPCVDVGLQSFRQRRGIPAVISMHLIAAREDHRMPALGRHFLTFLRSLCATPLSLPSWLSLLGLFFSLMCCFPGRLVSTLPVPVTLYRFAAACMHGALRI